MSRHDAEVLELNGHEVRVSNTSKVFFPQIGLTKGDIVRYYLAVAPGALRGVRDRPTILKRFPNGADADHFFQKRVPASRPEWLHTARVRFPSGRTADFLSIHDEAHLIWAINLGCIDLNPWPVRADDVDHPDELRVDLDPTPEASFADVRRVALEVRDVLAEHGMTGYPKTSGSRGIHINVRIEPRWDFTVVRAAALALGREVANRIPDLATIAWWKEERHGVFIDYNQNARDRTIASAYSVRPVPDARVSCPLDWDEVAEVDPAAFTMRTVPQRFVERDDPAAGIDDEAFSLEPLLALGERQRAEGADEAPWPPHFPKARGEPRRVAPSRAAKKGGAKKGAAKKSAAKKSAAKRPARKRRGGSAT